MKLWYRVHLRAATAIEVPDDVYKAFKDDPTNPEKDAALADAISSALPLIGEGWDDVDIDDEGYEEIPSDANDVAKPSGDILREKR